MKRNNEFIQNRIDEMKTAVESYKMELPKAPSKKTATGYLRTIDLFEQLELVCYDNDITFEMHENSNNGILIEAVVKSFLKGKTMRASTKGENDLSQGGKFFEIKALIKGSSSLPSVYDSFEHDTLLITNTGAFILPKEQYQTAIANNYMKEEKKGYKLRTTILNSGLLKETQFTKRITKEMRLNVYDGR